MVTVDKSWPRCQATAVPPEPREKGVFPMATYDTIRGQMLARVPGIDPADIPGVLQMLVYMVRGPERWDVAPARQALAGLEALWGEELADLQEVIAAQQRDGRARGLAEPTVEAAVMASLRHAFLRSERLPLSR